jgi:hypothetical protein
MNKNNLPKDTVMHEKKMRWRVMLMKSILKECLI